MSNIPANLHYTKTHEWIKKDDNGTVTIGITDFAQQQLGDLVYVDLPALHKQVKAGQETAVVESVKTAADVYSPIDGEIIAVNEKLKASPDTVNQDPYEQGWLYKIKMSNPKQLEELLAAAQYKQSIED